MRRILLAVAALTLTLSMESSASAAERCPKCGQVHGPTVAHRQASANPLQQLMQLEKRKNAWLARTFLGR